MKLFYIPKQKNGRKDLVFSKKYLIFAPEYIVVNIKFFSITSPPVKAGLFFKKN